MDDHKHRELSENEQMYLVTIAQLQEEGIQGAVPLSKLAETLDFLPVSVNQMVRKLADDGLLSYKPYKGVEFSRSGKVLVQRILRYRRLWEVFLVKNLDMQLDEADALACRLEHVTTDQVAERLAVFLDNPPVCYHGLPIPSLDIKIETSRKIRLAQLRIGETIRVNRILADAPVLAFLNGEGFSAGNEVTLIALGDNQSMLLKMNGSQLFLTAELAEYIELECQTSTAEKDLDEALGVVDAH